MQILGMKFFEWCQDGGPEPNVSGLFVVEIKWLFSIVLLHFADGSRDAYHSHAFCAISWIFSGALFEDRLYNPEEAKAIDGQHRGGEEFYTHGYKSMKPSIRPVVTSWDNLHRVTSKGSTWAISFRGPWRDWWNEVTEDGDVITLTSGRKEKTRIRSLVKPRMPKPRKPKITRIKEM